MQRDLFGTVAAGPATLGQSPDVKMDFLQKYRVTLRMDQGIIAALMLIVAYIFVFSFGVESGKRYAMAEIKAERAMRERMARELGEKIFANQAIQPAEQKKESAVPLPANPAVAVAKTVQTPAPAGPFLNDKFAIQTATLTSKTMAEQALSRLRQKGLQGKILSRGKFFEVCITGYLTHTEAFKAMVGLKSQGIAPKDAYIRTAS